MTAVHIDARDGRWLTPADELSDIELGDRVDLWQTHWELVMLYSHEPDRVRGGTMYMVGAVAAAAYDRNLPFPQKWWPPSAGEMPART